MLFKEDAVARAEAKAVREHAAWFRWTHDTVRLSGKDADAFAAHVFANTVEKAAVGRGKYTCMLDEGGHIIDDLVAFHKGEGLWWLSTLYGPHMVRWFDAHREGFDVAYEDITAELDMYAVQGPASTELVDAIAGAPVDELKRFGFVETAVGGASVMIDKGGFTGELGYEIYCSRDDSQAVEAAIAAAAEPRGVPRLTTLEVYVRSLPMEKGIGLRQDYFGLTPYEANLGFTVLHADEKDFIGKQAMLAAHEAGEKRAFVGFEIERESYEDIGQNEIVYKRGIPVGKVRQMIYGYTVDKNIGLGIVDAAKCPVGTRVTIGCNDSPAVVVAPTWC